MPRGQPDYSNPEYQLAQSYADPALLTIGSVGFAPVENLGRPLLLETWREGIGAWHVGTYHASTTIAASTAWGTFLPFIPPAFMVMDLPDEPINRFCYLERRLQWSRAGRFGLEFSVVTKNDPKTLTVTFESAEHGNYHAARLKFDLSTNEISISTDAGYVLLDQRLSITGYSMWNSIKLAVDTASNTYLRLVIGGNSYDLSPYSIENSATPDEDGIRILFRLANGAVGVTATVGVGHVLLTADEP